MYIRISSELKFSNFCALQIIQALKRLKGTTDKKTKMSEETKEIFDQLTESAMKLMENGEYS